MCFQHKYHVFLSEKVFRPKIKVNQQFMRHQSFTTVTLFPKSHQMVRIRFVSKCIN